MTEYTHKGLAGDSQIYSEQADVYEQFSQAEDFDGLVFNALKPIVQNKTVLDLGCGTGKYLSLLAPYAKEIIGLDAAEDQLRVSREKTSQYNNVTLLAGDITEVDLSQYSFDVIIACWVLPTIRNKDKRLQSINRVMQQLTPNGAFYAVENDSSGFFEKIRNRIPQSTSYNTWLEQEAGFTLFKDFKSRFVFKDAKTAKLVFAKIWGSEVASYITSREIEHNIVIFKSHKT